MAARADSFTAHPVAAQRAPVQPAVEPGGNTLPELDRRLLMQRTAMVDLVERLRGRMRQDFRNLSPLEQAQRHPEAALAIAGGTALLIGLIMGRMVGGLTARLFG